DSDGSAWRVDENSCAGIFWGWVWASSLLLTGGFRGFGGVGWRYRGGSSGVWSSWCLRVSDCGEGHDRRAQQSDTGGEGKPSLDSLCSTLRTRLYQNAQGKTPR